MLRERPRRGKRKTSHRVHQRNCGRCCYLRSPGQGIGFQSYRARAEVAGRCQAIPHAVRSETLSNFRKSSVVRHGRSMETRGEQQAWKAKNRATLRVLSATGRSERHKSPTALDTRRVAVGCGAQPHGRSSTAKLKISDGRAKCSCPAQVGMVCPRGRNSVGAP